MPTFNNRIKQVLLLSIIILLGYLVVIELGVFLPGLLGALTLYILSRGNYFNLIYNRKWKKGWAAGLFILYYLLLIGLPVFVAIVLVSPKVNDFLDDPTAMVAAAKHSIVTIQERVGFKFVSEATLTSSLGKLSAFIPTILNGKGRTLIGWDEILEGGLAPNALVMSWRGEEGGIAAAKENHDVVMTPGGWVYLDHSQSQNEDSVTIGGYTSVEKTYSYEPVPASLDAEQAKHILGAQGNVWTEYMKNTRKVEYMIFPRMSALSEVLWSPKEKRDWKDFEKRLQTQFKRYNLWKTNYSKAYFDLKASISPTSDYSGISWSIANKFDLSFTSFFEKIYSSAPRRDTVPVYDKKDISKIIRYDIDTSHTWLKQMVYGSDKNPENIIINRSGIFVVKSCKVSQAPGSYHLLQEHNSELSLEQNFYFNKATGKKITLTNEPSKNYPGDGAFTLVNGVQNEKGLARSREFLGWTGDDLEAIIDLGNSQTISNAVIHSLSSGGSWVYPPKYAEVFISSDGQTFTSAGKSEKYESSTGTNGVVKISFASVSARYIKVVVKNLGIIPVGNRGAGNKAWLFVDEIEVQ